MSGLSCALALLFAYLPDLTGFEEQIRQSKWSALDAGDFSMPPLLPAYGVQVYPLKRAALAAAFD